MVITLIGYRGSGKTTVAKPLAEQLDWNWVDADVEIERRSGQTIQEIFAAEGEPAFREWERLVLKDLLAKPQTVVAAGGGAVLSDELCTAMREAGLVVWLKASVDVLVERISSDPATTRRRPNLTASGGREEIEALLAQREPRYRETAHRVLESESAPPEELARTIKAWALRWKAEESAP